MITMKNNDTTLWIKRMEILDDGIVYASCEFNVGDWDEVKDLCPIEGYEMAHSFIRAGTVTFQSVGIYWGPVGQPVPDWVRDES